MSDHLTPPDLRDQMKALGARISALELRVASTDPWHEIGSSGEPAFQNGWGNLDGRTARFFKDPNNIVRLQGFITAGTVGQPAFFLPAGYRIDTGTTGDLPFPVVSNSAFGNLQVRPDGGVVPAVYSAWMSLAGVNFRAA